MTPLDALAEVLARVGAGKQVFITEHELNQWPADAVSAMKLQKLVSKAPPAASTVCPGCEQNCAMPVDTIPSASGKPASFVVCDKRSDINRVPIPLGHLVQWQANTTAVAQFISHSLSMRWQGGLSQGGDLEIGIVKATRKSQMLCLRSDRELALVVGTGVLPMIEVTTFAEGRFALDLSLVEQLVNSSNTSDVRYTPSNAKREARKLDTKARIDSWRRERRNLKKRHPDKSDAWCAIQISKMEIGEGRNSETIRKNMK